MAGPSSTTTIGGDLFVDYNDEWVDVTVLYGLHTVATSVSIANNLVLTDVVAQALVGELDVIGGVVMVSGNN